MGINSTERLCDWGARLEQALGIPIVVDQSGALLLKTKGGNVFSVVSVPGEAALVFTGVLGMADEAMRPATLRALLAINISVSFSGMGYVGIEPETHEILFRLPWMPIEASWTEQAFAAVLAAFAEHVDALTLSIANGEIEQLLGGSAQVAGSRAREVTDVDHLA